MAKVKIVRATLLEMYNRITKLVGSHDKIVYQNGDNNLYPNEIESVITNSPTASRCAAIMAKYIAGKGVIGDDGAEIDIEQLPIINSAKNYTIIDIIDIASRNIAKHKGCWFKVDYGIEFDGDNPVIKPVSIDVIDYLKPRISKEDSDGNKGKVYISDWGENEVFKKNKDNWFYPFNSNQDVILAQIKADNDGDVEDLEEAIKNYRGQIYYLNLTPEYIYSISPAHAVYNDCDTEYRMSAYSNEQTRSGFLGKTTVVTQGLEQEQEEQVKLDLQTFLGPEGSGNMYHLNVEQATSLEEVIKFVQLKPNFDDKLFESTDKRILRNIFGAFNNIPPALVLASEGSLFGTNADTYEEMKKFYTEQTEEERSKLERTLAHLGFPVKIKTL